jgi:small nuclear ribonucleoprotein (snRNP)-like protein
MDLSRFFRKYPELKKVIVNLKSGTSFRGLIWDHTGSYVVMREVEMLSDRDNTTRKAVDGEIAVRAVDIDFIQVL